MSNQLNDSTISGVKKIVFGSLIAELGAYEIIDGTRQDLKSRVKKLIHASNDIQSFYKYNEKSGKELIETFRQVFNSGKNVLISEIVVMLSEITEEDVEDIHNQIKNAINDLSHG